jgi:hypothetical protein
MLRRSLLNHHFLPVLYPSQHPPLLAFRPFYSPMSKRQSEEPNGTTDLKKPRKETMDMYNKIATAENAAKVDKNPPLEVLLDKLKNGIKKPEKGESVMYWMRMEDLRGKSFVCHRHSIIN